MQNYNSQHVIFIRSEKNKGLAYALNKLISVALVNNEFDFIARMDADDISLEDRFQRQIDFFMANPELDVVGGLCQEFGGESAREKNARSIFTDEAIKKTMPLKKCPFVHPTVMFKSSVFNNGMRYPEKSATDRRYVLMARVNIRE
ncbi:glycosyltransferase [Escherichia coli]